jgi:hypothetical protein
MGHLMRTLLVAAALVIALVGLDLFVQVSEPAVAALDLVEEPTRSGNLPSVTAEPHRDSFDASARGRAWSAQPIEFDDPARPARGPNPFVEPELHLTRDETRAGLDPPP